MTFTQHILYSSEDCAVRLAVKVQCWDLLDGGSKRGLSEKQVWSASTIQCHSMLNGVSRSNPDLSLRVAGRSSSQKTAPVTMSTFQRASASASLSRLFHRAQRSTVCVFYTLSLAPLACSSMSAFRAAYATFIFSGFYVSVGQRRIRVVHGRFHDNSRTLSDVNPCPKIFYIALCQYVSVFNDSPAEGLTIRLNL